MKASHCAWIALAFLTACSGSNSNVCGDGSSADHCATDPTDAHADINTTDTIDAMDAVSSDTLVTSDAYDASDAMAGDTATTDASSDGHSHMPPDAGWVDSPSLDGLPSIPSNFDINMALGPAWGTGAIPGPYGDGIAEGAFRLVCEPAQLLWDDPIVYPGRPGASPHLHQFFGNRLADANSTFDSLRTTGGSSCNWISDGAGGFLPIAANRSAYWVPALLDGAGNVVRPDYLTVYYKRHTVANGCRPTAQTPAIGTCIPLPHGLRYIFGRNLSDLAGSLNRGYEYRCEAAGTGHYTNLPDVLAACPTGSRIIAWASAPSCWDGMHLDSPNHRDHMAYTQWMPDGTLRCPTTHPYLIPQFELGQVWNVDGLDHAMLRMSSDDAAPGEPRGSTYHADWWGAWDPQVLTMWSDNCINGGRDGSGGDLCNGRALLGASQPSYGWSNPNRLVPMPPRP